MAACTSARGQSLGTGGRQAGATRIAIAYRLSPIPDPPSPGQQRAPGGNIRGIGTPALAGPVAQRAERAGAAAARFRRRWARRCAATRLAVPKESAMSTPTTLSPTQGAQSSGEILISADSHVMEHP